MSFTGVGTILRKGQGTNPVPVVASDSFDVVGRVRNIGGPTIAKQQVEDDTLDAASGYKEYLSGLRDAGTLEFALSFTPGTASSPLNQHQAILADINASTAASRRNWQIEWPDGTKADFQGEVFNVAMNTEPNSPVDANITVQINGAVTFTFP